MPAPKLLATAGLMFANLALTMTKTTEGPRLDDLKFTQGDYGAPLPIVWGKRRMQGNVFFAEDLREVKRQRKTKGGKFNEYTYYGTWAVAICGHEIDAVTRIWFDTHLVYDLTGAGPVTPFDYGDNRTGTPVSEYITIYTGAADQQPDPRMEATIEAEFGEGSCPAYRDTAYVMFKDVPLEKLGNRIPQVSVEYVSEAAPLYPYEVKQFGSFDPSIRAIHLSPDGSRIYVTGDHYEIWDTLSRTMILSGVTDYGQNFLDRRMTFDANGRIPNNSGAPATIVSISPDFTNTTALYATGGSNWQIEPISVQDGDGIYHLFSAPYSLLKPFFFDEQEYTMLELTGVDWAPDDCFADEYGDIWLVGAKPLSGQTTAYLYRMVSTGNGPAGSDFITIEGLAEADQTTVKVKGTHYAGGGVDHFVIAWDNPGTAYTVERDGTVTNTYAGGLQNAIMKRFGQASTVWAGTTEVSLVDLSVVRTIDESNWISNGDNSAIYDPINHALIGISTASGQLTWRYLDRASSDGVTVGTVASGVSQMVGVETFDFSDLDQQVEGWSAVRGPAANMLEPLLDAYDSDIRPHDFGIEGIKRTGVSGGAIATSEMVGDPRYTVSLKQGADLPRSLTIEFADLNADQQPNNVLSDRPLDATGARGEQTIDLKTLVLDPDEARQLGDRYFRRIWNERKDVSTGLTAQELALEPGDVRSLELDGNEADYRLVSVVVSADDSLQTEWKYDHPSLATLNGGTGASFDGRDPSEIIVPLPTKGFVLDIPLLADSDNSLSPQLYTAAGPYADGVWPGATVFQSLDGEYSDEFDQVPSSESAAWGYADNALGNANPWLWDRGNSVNVTLQTGELTGATEAAIEANPTLNLALMGDEIVQFANATLETDGSYTLSGFLRGRRGTEWATGTHASRDVFLLLNTADAVDAELSDVGTDLSFKAITSGRTDGFEIPVSFTGASLKPYAPHALKAVKQSNGDWVFTWVRRTRIGGAWTSGTSIPLGEASEEYQITVGNGSSSDTKTVTSATYTWAVATQTTDTGGEVLSGALEWSVAQVSDAVGAGFLATA